MARSKAKSAPKRKAAPKRKPAKKAVFKKAEKAPKKTATKKAAKTQAPRKVVAPRLDWNDLFSTGTLIDFSVHLWRARIRMTAEDLGIDETADVQQAISFGCHRLAPAQSFEKINRCVREWQDEIESNSLAFPLLSGVRYVPDSRVDKLQQELERHQCAFQLAVAEFLDNYEAIVQEQMPTIKAALQDASKTPEAADFALQRVMSEYPSRQKVAEKFGLEWNFFTISVPTSKAAAQTAKAAAPQISKVITSMVEQLRTELAEKVATLLSLAKKAQAGESRAKDGFGTKTKESAQKVLDKVDRLNFLQDATLREQTRILRSLLESDVIELDSVARDLVNVQTALETDIASAAAAAEKKLTGVGNRRIIT